MLSLYDQLRDNREFANDCRNHDRLDAATPVGDRRTSEAAVAFYLKWEVYPIPSWLLNDGRFRNYLEHYFERNHRVVYMRISPLTTEAEAIAVFRRAKQQIRRRRKIPNLNSLRVALLHDYLINSSAFHAFKPSDFAMAMGSKATRGKIRRQAAYDDESILELSNKEMDQADRILAQLVKRGIPYPIAARRAKRQITKKRWREGKLTPQIRMATRRALRSLKTLLSDPNI
jgi:hypothetical protein